MTAYRREKLAAEPRRVRGWRTVRSGAHRIRVALLPGGKSRAVALLHPKGEKRNPHKHCGLCRLPGHDRRAHRGGRNPMGQLLKAAILIPGIPPL